MNDHLYPDMVIRTGDYTVTSLCFLQSDDVDMKPDQYLVTGTENGLIDVWHLPTQSVIQTVDTKSTMVLSTLPWENRGRSCVIVYTRGQKVMVLEWCNKRKQLLLRCELQLTENLCPTFCQMDVMRVAGKSCLSIPEDKAVQFYSVDWGLEGNDIEKTSCRIINAAMVTCIKVFTASELDSTASVLVGDEAGNVSLYHIYNGLDKSETTENGSVEHSRANQNWKLLSTLNAHGQDPVLTLDFSPGHMVGVSAGGGGKVSIWKLNNNKLVTHIDISTPSKGFNSVRIRTDNKLVVLCSWDGVIRLYSLKKGKLLALMDFQRESVTSVGFDSKNNFVTASKDRMLCLWGLYSNKL